MADSNRSLQLKTITKTITKTKTKTKTKTSMTHASPATLFRPDQIILVLIILIINIQPILKLQILINTNIIEVTIL